jgi:predicted NAD/FAD-dependent oxidoreductase
MRIAIIGAGMAGLAAGTRLTAAGHDVRLFDKGRGAGGRMASRRVETAAGQAVFDHGAQYFTVRDADFAACVATWGRAGRVAPWPAAGPTAFVGTPAMNAPLRAMAERLDVRWQARVDTVERDGNDWHLRGDGVDTGPHDAIICAIPAEQAAVLLAPVSASFAGVAAAAVSAPCWTVMLAFAAPVAHTADILPDPAEPIGWAARNRAKPGRAGPEAWVVQASPQWSTTQLEDDADTVIAALQAALARAVGGDLPPVLAATAHRWRYARAAGTGDEWLWDQAQGIGVCGDWLVAPRVEAAWLSGHRLAGAIGA